MSLPVMILLLAISLIGLLLGGLYYARPQLVVHRRIKNQHWDMAKKDDDFRRWLNVEIDSQVRRTRRMGLIVIVLEAIWIVLVLGMWARGGQI